MQDSLTSPNEITLSGPACFPPRRNHQSYDKRLLSTNLADGCALEASVHSVSFFSLPTGSRRCLLSLSLAFKPGKRAYICDFAASWRFSPYLSEPPTVLGYQFLNLEQDTCFLRDFRADLFQDPCQLGQLWYKNGYESLFTATGDSYDGKRVVWGVGKGSNKFRVQGEGQLGSCPGVIDTIPITVLLEYKEAIPSVITASLSFKYHTERARGLSLGKLVHLPRRKVKFGLVRLCEGPILPLLPGDTFAVRKSFQFRSSPVDRSVATSPVVAPEQEARPQPKDIVSQLLDTCSGQDRRELFLAGEAAFLDRLRQNSEGLTESDPAWADITRRVSSIYGTARLYASQAARLGDVSPRIASDQLGDPVVERRDMRTPSPRLPAAAPAKLLRENAIDESPLDPGYA